MKIYQGISGGIYNISDKCIGRGGEGSIHEIENFPGHVAKIFKKNKCDSLREEKLCQMVKNSISDGVFQYTTWPKDVIYDQGGFAGYVMKKVENISSLAELYSDDKYNLWIRIFVAYNLCAAIEEIHNIGQVCGDLNPRNICINLNEHCKDVYQVILVDTDSYHFITKEKTYRCEVGLADYLAPEIQKKISGEITLRNAPLPTFTRETDLFALAVHIFCLLMNGSHPFACAKKQNGTIFNSMEQMTGAGIGESVVVPQPIENIKNGFFPFFHQRADISIPAYAPEFVSLHPNLQRLFIQTFVEGHTNPKRRAQASEWLAVLKPLIDGFKKISRQCVKEHIYFAHVMSCPYCYVEQKKLDALRKINSDNIQYEPPENSAENGAFRGTGVGGEPFKGVFPPPPPKKNERKIMLLGMGIVIALLILVIVALDYMNVR